MKTTYKTKPEDIIKVLQQSPEFYFKSVDDFLTCFNICKEDQTAEKIRDLFGDVEEILSKDLKPLPVKFVEEARHVIL